MMKNKRLRRTSIFIILATFIMNFINVNVAKGYNSINFRNITIEDGLSQGTVETIFQDSRGYIWIGTNDGLNIYNGYEYKLFSKEFKEDNGLINNYIVNINEDKDKNIWVGTIAGISKINTNTNDIQNYTIAEGLLEDHIRDSLVTASGDIYFATTKGVCKYNKEMDFFEEVYLGEDFKDKDLYTLDEDSCGNIWMGIDGAIQRFNPKEGSIDSYSLGDNTIYDLIVKDTNVWVATMDNGLYSFDINTEEIVNYNMDNSELTTDTILNLFVDNDDNLWLCTDNGLGKFDYENEKYIVYNNKLYDKNSLINDDVYSIMQDNLGLIWVGTYSGISVFDPSSKMKHYKNDPFDKNTIENNMINGIYKDGKYLWIGTNSKGINIIELNEEEDRVYRLDEFYEGMTLSSQSINDITGDKCNIYIATDDGVNIINKSSGINTVISTEDGLNNNLIKNLLIDSKGYLWIGTIDGFNIIDLKSMEVINIDYIFNNLEMEDYYSGAIYEDRDGVYWLGSFLNGGLVKINPSNKEVQRYTVNEGLSNNSIRTIIDDDEGNLWIGTSLGLNCLNKDSEEIKIYTTKEGLPNNTIYGVLIDNSKDIWVSTNKGLSKYDTGRELFINFDVTDGLQSNEFNGEAYFISDDGELFFGGINGLNSFFPEDICDSSSVSTLVIDTFEVNGRKRNFKENIKLKYRENNIHIAIFLPEYKNTESIKYYYKLEGASGEWSEMESNEISLTNLSSGRYTFIVKARNSNGVMSEEQKINFTIKPPLWRSKVALFIYILIIIFIIIARSKKMKLLDELVEKRTYELSEEMKKSKKLLNKIIDLEKRKNTYLVNISHELRTPLNVLYSIQQLIRELNKGEKPIEKASLEHYMLMCEKNIKRLLKTINDLIDSSKIENGNYNIVLKKEDIVYIVEETALSMKDYIESKEIELIIDPEIEECVIDCDKTEIERCIINLVNNAVKFTLKGGRILISIKESDSFVTIEVSDTGIGIEEKHLESIFDRFNQVIDSQSEVKGGSGLGLAITKQIVTLHKGEIFVESQVNKGSKFTIILPK